MLKELQRILGTNKSEKGLNDGLLYTDYAMSISDLKEDVIPADLAFKYQGNLIAVFRHLGVPPHYYIHAMYVNGYTHSSQYDGIKTVFLLPYELPEVI